MKSIFKKIFTEKNDPVDFTKIITEREKLVVIFPDATNQTYEIFSYILNWEKLFKEFLFILPEFSLPFFQHLNMLKNAVFYELDSIIESVKNSVIINFNESEKINRFLKSSINSIIISTYNYANLQFIPHSENSLKLLNNFADFFSFPFTKKQILLKNKPEFFSNVSKKNFKIIFSLKKRNNLKHFNKLIQKLKLYFSVQTYIIDRNFQKFKEPNIKQNISLLKLFLLLNENCILLSDDVELIKLFSHFNVNEVYLGKNKFNKDIKSTLPQNVFELKNIIQDILDRKI